MHKDNIWQNAGREFFSQIIKSGHSINMIYCIYIICGRVFYKNPCLKGDSYIHELPTPLSLFITALFVDHHPNKPPLLEDITTFYMLFANIAICQTD